VIRAIGSDREDPAAVRLLHTRWLREHQESKRISTFNTQAVITIGGFGRRPAQCFKILCIAGIAGTPSLLGKLNLRKCSHGITTP
jgi:hypothetical protein